jgi:hypothetical protein
MTSSNDGVNEMIAGAGYDNVKEFSKRVRNETIDEIADELQRFTWAFGGDTVSSFVVFIKGMKE